MGIDQLTSDRQWNGEGLREMASLAVFSGRILAGSQERGGTGPGGSLELGQPRGPVMSPQVVLCSQWDESAKVLDRANATEVVLLPKSRAARLMNEPEQSAELRPADGGLVHQLQPLPDATTKRRIRHATNHAART